MDYSPHSIIITLLLQYYNFQKGNNERKLILKHLHKCLYYIILNEYKKPQELIFGIKRCQ